MARSVKKFYDPESLSKFEDDVLFDVLKNAVVEDIDDKSFKYLIKECLVRIFYSDQDFYFYGLD
jgi:ATP-dependent Clp protease ATP-binding subunit ClpA